MTTVRIVCVDDHPLFRDGVTGLLATIPWTDVVGACGTGEEAVRLVTELRPDIVLMDLNLPGLSGIEATRRLRIASPATKVLVLSMLDDDASVLEAMRVGASGYVVKGAGQEELLAAVRTVVEGGAVFGGRVAGRVLDLMTGSGTAPTTSDLTEREATVLEQMVLGRDNAAIARELDISVKTVQNHVSRILAKLQARDRLDAVLKVRDTRI